MPLNPALRTLLDTFHPHPSSIHEASFLAQAVFTLVGACARVMAWLGGQQFHPRGSARTDDDAPLGRVYSIWS